MKARFFNSDAGLERGNVDGVAEVEAEWFQLTYSGLRAAPDGRHVAAMTHAEEWTLLPDANAGTGTFTDVVICAN